jgi:tetratricopeptide (TPR) repeat protein
MPNLEEGAGALRRSHRLQLPAAPASERDPVKAWQEEVNIFTYLPEPADPNPMFLEKRVYQGSSGRVYPLPYIDRIASEGKERAWQAVHIENEYLRLMVLPEIGGRIHVGLDKINGYDFFYRQNVIKPALVGLAGPWISGGVELNWPQHHRPATFMPVEFQIERGPDGSATIWCSDHDPMSRMKGMHGVCLHPGKAYVELKVRLYNRTPYVQTFLWWANVATRVHEHYQSFFPRDVQYVADHAKRAVSRFPESQGKYYGVDYSERARTGVPNEERPRLYAPDGSYPANDLSWYANIPVPTSYMILGSTDDFFGGYDHATQAGVVHVADHHIAPGKKQWTWGNHEFGYAWDRNLTEEDGPYVELMAGVYTDNQPDFSFLAPGETKEFSQFWYPIRKIGVPQTANLHAALNIRMEPGRVHLGISATEDFPRAQILLERAGEILADWKQPITIVEPLLADQVLPEDVQQSELSVVIREDGRELLRYTPHKLQDDGPPPVAKEPAMPEAISSTEELYLTGLHLQQYRHATRSPEAYWREALRRDERDSRANHALGLWHLHRGEFVTAERHFRRAIERLASLNPNPYDGEAFYSLGLSLRFQKREEEAYAFFYKATWNAAWKSPAYYALAELDLKNGRWEKALEHLRLSLRVNMDNLNARNLAVVVLKRMGREGEAEAMLSETRRLDRLDIWSRYLKAGEKPKDNRLRMDLALDYARAGFWDDAIALLASADTERLDGSAPMVVYMLAWCQASRGDHEVASATYRKAAQAPPLYCFPNLLEEIEILQAAIAADPADARAPYYLGNLLYDRRRHEEAIELWELSARLDSSFATVWRNLAFAYFNILHQEDKARNAFDRAFAANPQDARVLYERDQLWKRIGESPETRLRELERHPDLVSKRDDLAVELATLYDQTGKPDRALNLLKARKFQPWEGGEGLVLGQWMRANLMMGRQSLAKREAAKALSYIEAALAPPENLGEARHLLANQSEIFYWAGVAASNLGDAAQARSWWEKAAASRGDFREMTVQSVSEMTYWSALAFLRLGRQAEAHELLRAIESYSWELEKQTPKIDYFATSLPAMLLFEENLARRNLIEAKFLRAQALLGLDRTSEAAVLLNSVLEKDRNQLRAADLLQDLMEQSATGPRN